MATSSTADVLQAILGQLQQLNARQTQLEAKVSSLSLSSAPPAASVQSGPSFNTDQVPAAALLSSSPPGLSLASSGIAATRPPQSTSPFLVASAAPAAPAAPAAAIPPSPSLQATTQVQGPYSQRVILTTYPGQVGIHPIPLNWGAPTATERGPVVASRQTKSIKIRNAIGAHGGTYSVYRALATASGLIDPNHRPDYTNTHPPVSIPYNAAWSDPHKIVSIDPWGHVAPQVFKSFFDAGIDIRPTISITRAHIKLIDIDALVRSGSLEIDGKIVVRTPTEWVAANRAASSNEAKTQRAEGDAALRKSTQEGGEGMYDSGVELNVNKAALEPVWWLPGIAERFNISEAQLRRSLFEDTGGMYPELLTRHDLKTFLPPIGGMTVYIFGPPEYLSDESKELTLRVHDECNGSDVFGSDICTCRPYLIFGIEEAVKCAQRGGVGVVVYFRKEGRALGEVLKFLVYNARKRGGDSAAEYFRRTEAIAGVKDMRFQVLMPDVLHWLGVKKIDNMISMSDLKHDAIVNSGIPILKRYEIPEDLIPPDSRVEIDAKIAAGYFSTTAVTNLAATHGRAWEDVDH